jgi:hypothetical protein
VLRLLLGPVLKHAAKAAKGARAVADQQGVVGIPPPAVVEVTRIVQDPMAPRPGPKAKSAVSPPAPKRSRFPRKVRVDFDEAEMEDNCGVDPNIL